MQEEYLTVLKVVRMKQRNGTQYKNTIIIMIKKRLEGGRSSRI